MKTERDIKCSDVGCQMQGHFRRREQTGEHLILWNARHNHERHVTGIKLAEEAVRTIKRDKQFREYFMKLLNA